VTASFSIPLPPSLNNIFFNKPHGGRAKTTAYKNWLEEAALRIRMQRVPVIEGEVSVHVTIQRPNAQSDLDNRIKAVLDALQKSGVLKNDKQVSELHARWGAVEGATVLVSSIVKAAA
jgi:crossover junction endodeoxyribonuclease RusA